MVVDTAGGGLGPLLSSPFPPGNVVLIGIFCGVVLVVDTVVLYSSVEGVMVSAVVGTEERKAVLHREVPREVVVKTFTPVFPL